MNDSGLYWVEAYNGLSYFQCSFENFQMAYKKKCHLNRHEQERERESGGGGDTVEKRKPN